MKFYIFVILVFTSLSANAGGLSNATTPTGIDIVQAGTVGFMLYGQFGNIGECTTSVKVFVKKDNPHYEQFYSTALAAFMAGKKIQVYIHTCEAIGWYSPPTITYNVLGSGGSLYLRN